MNGQIMYGFQRASGATMLSGGIKIIFCIFMMLLFIGVITFAVIFMVKVLRTPKYMQSLKNFGVQPHSSSGAIEILNERYAKGELTQEEYSRTKEDILKP